MIRRQLLMTLATLAACIAGLPGFAQAQSYPSKAVTIVVPYPAGGSADAMMRPIAERLGKLWHQPVVVENRSGANGIVATQYVLAAPADGHTVLLHLTGFIQNLSLYRKLPYDPFKDLTPLTQIGTQTMGLAVSSTSPYNSLQALASAVKARPADFSYGSFGIGSTGHIFGELLKTRLQADMPHVPYRGEGPMLPDVMSGRVPLAFVSAATAATRQKDKTLRILAVTGPQREAALPDVPTLAELGYKGFEPVGWYGLFVPAATPKTVADKISADVRSVMRQPDIAARLRDLSIEPTGTTQAEFAQLLKTDHGRWDALIKQFRIELE